MKKRTERGFVLIELMIVVAIIGILVNLAFPQYYRLIKKAEAAKVIGDLHSIHIAVSTYYAGAGDYPDDRGPGSIPPKLKPYLDEQISFKIPDLDILYDWDNWSGENGNPDHSHTGVIYGISVTTKTNMALVNTIKGMLGESNFLHTLNNNYTYIIQGSQ
jgi:prepilin-type N-terminal cleavage/methylation domain-containing protein